MNGRNLESRDCITIIHTHRYQVSTEICFSCASDSEENNKAIDNIKSPMVSLIFILQK